METMDVALALTGFALTIGSAVYAIANRLHNSKTELLTQVISCEAGITEKLSVLTERVDEIKNNDLEHIHDRLGSVERTLIDHLTRAKG